ncbi:hypothetical protein QJS10_CPB13g00656 [Acorus calamus]|uniref:Uncharacterized protein n=1 Tax=Acorus calamus TaxID=4465 RepID=A0AAV9DH67_ACOCL|nr:hypothetical protein QJS10_CPB13g00656 [Acorus calamus]
MGGLGGCFRRVVQPLLSGAARNGASAGLFTRLHRQSPSPLVRPSVEAFSTSCIYRISSSNVWMPQQSSWVWNQCASFHSLTDTRYPKRRPSSTPRRKRASLRPPGPVAWVKYVPGEPIPRSRPNEGSIQGRNQKKRIRQRKEFTLAERRKRRAECQEASSKREVKKIERKMAAVARERAWTQRLAELQQLEQAKKAAATA